MSVQSNKPINVTDHQLNALLDRLLSPSDRSNKNKVSKTTDSILPILTHYCIGCQSLLEFESKIFTTCGKPDCLYIAEEFLLDNFVSDFFHSKPEIASFLLQSAIYAIRSERRTFIFEPFPRFLLKSTGLIPKRGELSSLIKSDQALTNINDVKDFDTLNIIANKFSLKELTKICTTHSTDSEIFNTIGRDSYLLVKFILKSNQTEMKPISIFMNTNMNDSNTNINVTHKVNLTSIQQFQVTHPSSIEDSFQNKVKSLSQGRGTIFLYHGSSMENWYSIMRNGLKITSGTRLMANGAAHGNGIYLSSDINLSQGYAGGNEPTFGVYEVINCPEKYTQTNIVFVVKDDSILLLRYLFSFPSIQMINDQNIKSVLNTKFNVGIYEEKRGISIAVDAIKNKRLLGEYKKIASLNPSVVGFHVEIPDESNFHLWKIFITKFDGSPIEKDMKQLGITAIELEATFPDRYPLNPPFIRIISPRFQFRTGHITAGGSICMELLTNKGWSAVYSLETIIYDIKANVIEGDGQIDLVNYSRPYTMAEAKDAFNRMVASHGW